MISDILAAGKGRKIFSRDFIGAGPRTISGILKDNDISSRIYLFNNSTKKNMRNYDVLMISGMSMDYQACKIITKFWRAIKNRNKNPIIIGGPIATGSTQFLQTLDFDVAVIGEGEKALIDILNKNILEDFENERHYLKKIDGISFKIDQKLYSNPITSYINKKAFNQFIPSAKHVTCYPNYFIARVYVECVRGCSNFNRTTFRLPNGNKCANCNICEENPNDRMNCPHNIPPGCGYCSVPSVYGPSRSKTKENLLLDINNLVREGVRKIILGGPDFLDYQREALVDSEWLMNPNSPPPNVEAIRELLTAIHEIPEINQKKVFVAIENIKPNLFSEELASIIAKYLPNTWLSIGCETGSPRLARAIGRPSTPRDALNAVKIAKKHGIKVHTYFIHNLPGQDEIAVHKTRDLMMKFQKIGIEKVTIYKFKPLPSTAFENFRSKETRFSKKLKKLAIKMNYEQKKKLLGKVVRLFILERHFQDPSIGIGVFLTEGPTVLVFNAGNLIGKEVDVKINEVISDKLVGGSLII
ncbi:MAG: B12-binding domain-containing radical SAM protein [Candidatus Helarchaeota archaeon]